jgi:hypothetical protein
MVTIVSRQQTITKTKYRWRIILIARARYGTVKCTEEITICEKEQVIDLYTERGPSVVRPSSQAVKSAIDRVLIYGLWNYEITSARCYVVCSSRAAFCISIALLKQGDIQLQIGAKDIEHAHAPTQFPCKSREVRIFGYNPCLCYHFSLIFYEVKLS